MEPPNLEALGPETTDEEEREDDKAQRVGLEQPDDEQKRDAAGAGIGDATTTMILSALSR